MKLSQLVNYKNLLDAMSVKDIERTTNAEIDKIMFLANNQPGSFEAQSKNLEIGYQEISASFDKFNNSLNELKTCLQEKISEVEKPLFAESYRLYDQEMSNETVNDVRDRKVNLDKEVEDFLTNRLTRYIGWQHPAMIVRPGFESYIDHMVACDPLYLVDLKHELIAPAIQKFNELYQNRLRTYVVSERENDGILKRLPDNQFGLIFAYNFFNFRPFELIRHYLKEMHTKLKPGGILIMTINDCDRDKGVGLAENKYCCYTPGYLIEEMSKTIGYEIVFKWHNNGPSTWFELAKPGELQTLRGGQSLAKIMPKPIA